MRWGGGLETGMIILETGNAEVGYIQVTMILQELKKKKSNPMNKSY